MLHPLACWNAGLTFCARRLCKQRSKRFCRASTHSFPTPWTAVLSTRRTARHLPRSLLDAGTNATHQPKSRWAVLWEGMCWLECFRVCICANCQDDIAEHTLQHATAEQAEATSASNARLIVGTEMKEGVKKLPRDSGCHLLKAPPNNKAVLQAAKVARGYSDCARNSVDSQM